MKKDINFIFFVLVAIGCLLNVRAQNQKVLVRESDSKGVLVPKTDIGNTWRASLNYGDSDWRLCRGAPGGVGYERDSGYENMISLDVAEDMYQDGNNPNSSCYIRLKFSISETDLSDIGYLKLQMRYDDGFVAYINGTRVAEANAPQAAVWNSQAAGDHEANNLDVFNITDFVNQLSAGENLLAIHGLNRNPESSDFLINVSLVSEENPISSFESSNLPLVFINSYGNRIPDEPKINAHMSIIYHNDGQLHRLNDSYNNYDGEIGIETRGSSSQSWRKKQYAVETRDENGNNLNVSLMGLPTENDWVLNAPFIDKSFLRNVLAYTLSRQLGHYASRTRFCELFLNGEYQGIYILMEKIKRDNDRIDISVLDSTGITGDAVTGGYIFKVDKTDGAQTQGFTSEHLPANSSTRRVFYQYHYPSQQDILAPQRAYLQRYVRDFEDMMAGNKYNDPVNGYAKWIDINSFIDFIIISELGKNVDSYRLSTFFYKDRDSQGGKLFAGPLWDYNLAFGLANYYDGEDTDGWMLEELLGVSAGDFQVPFWWYVLFDDPEFNHRLKQRWFELRGNVLSLSRLFQYIDDVADTLQQAQARNFAIWSAPGEPGEGFWPVPGIFQTFVTYQDEIDYLKQWIADRIAWIDENVVLLSGIENKVMVTKAFILNQNYPNPFNPETTIQFSIPRSGFVHLQIYNTQGQLVRTLINEFRTEGIHTIIWDSRDHFGQFVASGVYAYHIRITHQHEIFSQSKKMVVLR